MQKHFLAVAIGLLLAGSATAGITENKYGPYFGGDLGWGAIQRSSYSNGVVAGRIFGGYNLNNYLAGELGFTKLANVDEHIMLAINPMGPPTTIYSSAKTFAWDLVARANLPLQNGFSLFGRLGAAYLSQQYTYSTYINNFSADKIDPTFGLGASYDLNRHLAADISWMRIQQIDGGPDSTDIVGVGLTFSPG